METDWPSKNWPERNWWLYQTSSLWNEGYFQGYICGAAGTQVLCTHDKCRGAGKSKWLGGTEEFWEEQKKPVTDISRVVVERAALTWHFGAEWDPDKNKSKNENPQTKFSLLPEGLTASKHPGWRQQMTNQEAQRNRKHNGTGLSEPRGCSSVHGSHPQDCATWR